MVQSKMRALYLLEWNSLLAIIDDTSLYESSPSLYPWFVRKWFNFLILEEIHILTAFKFALFSQLAKFLHIGCQVLIG